MTLSNCVDCGATINQVLPSQVRCDLCQERRRRKQLLDNNRKSRAREFDKDKICIVCGSVFHSEKKSVTHCSQKCVGVTRRKAKEDKKLKGKATNKVKGMTITEIAVAARKENLTYGQYVIKYGL